MPDSRLIVKTVALIFMVLAPLQLALIHFGEEPWPALILPNFSGVKSVPDHFALREIYAVTDDGDRVPVEWSDLFPDLPGIEPSFQSLNFSPRRKPASSEGTRGKIADKLGSVYPFSNYWKFRSGLPHGNDPDVREWLGERLEDVFEGQTFDSLEFVWYGYEGFIRSAEIPADAVAETYVVDLH